MIGPCSYCATHSEWPVVMESAGKEFLQSGAGHNAEDHTKGKIGSETANVCEAIQMHSVRDLL